MRNAILSTVASIGALTSCVSAVVTLGISKSPDPPLRKRLNPRGTITESLINNVTGGDYIAKVIIGGQDMTLAIDTGSSDVWVLSNTADLCTSPALQNKYQTGGCASTYDSSKSKTYKLVDQGSFDISYADGSGATGDYISDTLSIGGSAIKALQMGLAHKATLQTGLLGIGYDVNEASDNARTQDSPFIYPSIIDQMVTQGLINIRAYSLYLDDLQSSSGSIIFGGMDTDKFHGSLYQLPIVPNELNNGSTIYAELGVEMTSFGMTSGTGITTNVTSSLFDVPAILDSGTTITYLPEIPVAKLFALINATDDTENSGEVYVDCNLRSQTSMTFNYGFGGSPGHPGVIIKVPVSELIFSLSGAFATQYAPPDLPYSKVCGFGIQSMGDEGPYILGDTFLRSAYVVYDLTNNIAALAQTNFNSSSSNIVEFQADQTAIPSVSGAASAPAVTQTATESVGVPVGPTKTAGATATVTSTPGTTPKSSAGSSTGASGSGASSSSSSAAVGSIAPFDWSRLVMLGFSGLFAVAGGALIA